MQLVATRQSNNSFFRAINVTEAELETAKTSMINNAKEVNEELNFKTMTETEFKEWLNTQQGIYAI